MIDLFDMLGKVNGVSGIHDDRGCASQSAPYAHEKLKQADKAAPNKYNNPAADPSVFPCARSTINSNKAKAD